MPRLKVHKFSPDDRRKLIYVVLGAAVNGAVIDPLLGHVTYNSPIKSPIEPYLTIGDMVTFGIDGAVFAAGYLADKTPLVYLGLGMLSEKLGEKMTLWVWNVLHPGKPTW